MLTTMEPMFALAAQGKIAQNAEPLKKGVTPYGEGRVIEPKLDGWRLIAYVGADAVAFWSRSGKRYDGKLPRIEEELLANCPEGTWLDGEACALTVLANGNVLDEWGTVQSVLSKLGGHAMADKVTFMVFDLLAHGGIDARSLPYAKRRALLESMFANGDFTKTMLAPSLPATEDTHATLVEKGFEGSIVKRLNAPYKSDGRAGAGWTKIKHTTTVDCVVMDFQMGKDGFAGMCGAIIFGQYVNGVLTERGKCSGMDMRTRLDITKNPEKWLGRVVEIAHMGVSVGAGDSGKFRHPQYKRMRTDKAAETCVWADA